MGRPCAGRSRRRHDGDVGVGARAAQADAGRREGRGEFIDALKALQVAKHVGDSTEQLVARFAAVAPKAAKGRGRTPGFVRGRTMPMLQPVGSSKEAWTFGYLVDVVLTRDTGCTASTWRGPPGST